MKKPAILIFLLVCLVFGLFLYSLETGYEDQGRRQLETALRQTAVACYAAEGFYPPSVDYMAGNYGLRYDKSRYRIHYEVFASNLMPDITVLEAAP